MEDTAEEAGFVFFFLSFSGGWVGHSPLFPYTIIVVIDAYQVFEYETLCVFVCVSS